MIRTRAASIFILSFSLALPGSLLNVVALAQGLPSVPNEVKTGGAAEVNAARQAIEAFINQAIAQMSTEGPSEPQSRARDALTKEALVNGQPAASAPYLHLYTQLLNAQLLNLAKHESTHVRLNAAIVTFSVARFANLANLAPAALAFMNDQSPAVVLWGVKAARPLLQSQLRIIGGGGQQLAPAIVAAARKHPTGAIGGAITAEAYDALTLDIFAPAAAAALQPQMISAVIPHLHDLMTFRVQRFRAGVPPEPGADGTGATFLVNGRVWPVQTPKQQAITVQLLSDLLALMAAQATAPNIAPADQIYLVRTAIPRIASSLSVAASSAGEAGIVAAVAPIVQPQRMISAQQMAALVQTVFPAITGSKAFAATKPPPSVTGNEPPPPPASAPTTGPIAIPGAAQPTTTVPPAAPTAAPAPAN